MDFLYVATMEAIKCFWAQGILNCMAFGRINRLPQAGWTGVGRGERQSFNLLKF